MESASVADNPWDDPTPEPVQPATTWSVPPSRESHNGPAEGITVTLKAGPGYEAPWIVIHAADAASALRQVKDAVMSELAQATVTMAQWFSTKASGAKPVNSGTPTQRSEPAGKPPSMGGPDGSKSCRHGEMTWADRVAKSGANSGRRYQAYMCSSTDRSDQCKAVGWKWMD